VGGAVLTVYNAAGQTTDQATYVLPAAGWKPLGSATAPKGWKYRGSVVGDDVISSVTVKADTIRVRGDGTYTLEEPTQGRVAVTLRLGGAQAWCAEAPAKLQGNPPSTSSSDLPGRFLGEPKVAPPVSCPAPPSGSPSEAFVPAA
jgi:hypothetical protein